MNGESAEKQTNKLYNPASREEISRALSEFVERGGVIKQIPSHDSKHIAGAAYPEHWHELPDEPESDYA